MTNKEKNNNYPYYVWTLTIFTAPLYWIIYCGLAQEDSWLGMIETIPVFFSLGLFYSLPLLALFALLFKILERKKTSSILSKFILSVFGVLGIFLTFKIIGGSIIMELALFYSLTFTFYTWVMKIGKRKN